MLQHQVGLGVLLAVLLEVFHADLFHDFFVLEETEERWTGWEELGFLLDHIFPHSLLVRVEAIVCSSSSEPYFFEFGVFLDASL